VTHRNARRLGLIVAVVAAAALGPGAAAQAAAPGLLLNLSTYSGTATYGEDLGPQSTTPISFTEQITWRLVGATQRRVMIGQAITVPVRVAVKGSAHGQYAVIDRTGQITSLVPYDCTSALARTQYASVRLTHRPSGVNRLTFALIREVGGLDPGAATCTDAEQAETLFFPTGSRWLVLHMIFSLNVIGDGRPKGRVTGQSPITHRCGSTPPCVEHLQSESRVRFTFRR
jgi:hypothetical protein